MFRGALFVRYSTYFFWNIYYSIKYFSFNLFLDVNEFSVWGISMSLIYVLSQLGQLTYVQYVDISISQIFPIKEMKTSYIGL